MWHPLKEYLGKTRRHLKPVYEACLRRREAFARRSLSWKALFFVVVFLAVALGGLLFNLTLAPTGKEKGSIVVDVPPGSSLQSVVADLEKKNLVKSRAVFSLMFYLHGWGNSGIRAGEYEFFSRFSQWRIARMLAKGITMIHKITVPEDWTVSQIAQRLEARRLIKYDTFMALARNVTFLQEAGVPAKSVEGFLYPETYHFDRMMGERRIMRAMIGQFHKEFDLQMELRASELGLSVREIVTLASMIGREAKIAEEKPLISAVFHNRLRLKMRLQSDPTAVYRFEEHRRKVSRNDLKRHSFHNTYVISGLPSGPIANPDRRSLLAALYPAPDAYLYFVALRNGSHIFSTDYRDHRRAIGQIYKRGFRNTAAKKETSRKPLL